MLGRHYHRLTKHLKSTEDPRMAQCWGLGANGMSVLANERKHNECNIMTLTNPIPITPT